MTAPQEPTTAPGAPAATSPTPANASPAPTPVAPNPWEGFQWDGKVDSLPEPIAKLIQDTRKEAGAARTNAKATAAQEARDELAKQFASWLGIGGEQPPSPEQLADHLAMSRAEAASMAAELRIVRIASKLGVDPDELLDSNRVCAQLDAIGEQIGQGDVAAFDAKATEVIQQWMAGRPQPATSTVTSRTPVEALRPGALPGAPQVSLDDQIREAQKAGDAKALIRLNSQKLAALAAQQK